jgi:hypothetical protein
MEEICAEFGTSTSYQFKHIPSLDSEEGLGCQIAKFEDIAF